MNPSAGEVDFRCVMSAYTCTTYVVNLDSAIHYDIDSVTSHVGIASAPCFVPMSTLGTMVPSESIMTTTSFSLLTFSARVTTNSINPGINNV